MIREYSIVQVIYLISFSLLLFSFLAGMGIIIYKMIHSSLEELSDQCDFLIKNDFYELVDEDKVYKEIKFYELIAVNGDVLNYDVKGDYVDEWIKEHPDYVKQEIYY